MLYAARFLGLSLALVALMGCDSGPETAVVTGKVLIDGQPPYSGAVSFTPTDKRGQAIEALIEPGGTYKATVELGPKKVGVRVLKKVGEQAMYPGQPNSPVTETTQEVKLEEKAKNLTHEVKSGGGPYDIDLKSTK